VRHYGDRPPWEGESRYGRWLWIAPSPQDWFEEPGYWQWYPPHPSWGSTLWQLNRVLKNHYLPAIRQTLEFGARNVERELFGEPA
jgi:hypothetical protein